MAPDTIQDAHAFLKAISQNGTRPQVGPGAARSMAKRRKWARFNRSKWAWELMPQGRALLRAWPNGF